MTRSKRKLGPITADTLKPRDVLCVGKWGARDYFLVKKVAGNSFSMIPLQWSPDAVNEPGVLQRVPGQAMPLVVMFSKGGALYQKRALEFFRESHKIKAGGY